MTIESKRVQLLDKSFFRLVGKDFSPIDDMFLYRSIEWGSQFTNTAQRVAGKLQRLTVR